MRKVTINPAAKAAARLIERGESATAPIISLHSGSVGTVATTGIPAGADCILGMEGMEGSWPCGVTNPLRRLICLRFVKYSDGENIGWCAKKP